MSTTQAGYTPLVAAALFGKCDVVNELLDNGADVNAQNYVSPINTVKVFLLQFLVSIVIMAQTSSWVS